MQKHWRPIHSNIFFFEVILVLMIAKLVVLVVIDFETYDPNFLEEVWLDFG